MKEKSGLKIYNKSLTNEGKIDIYGVFAVILLCVGMNMMLSESFPSIAQMQWVCVISSAVMGVGILFVLYSKLSSFAPLAITGLIILGGIVFLGKVKSGIAVMGNDYLTWLTTVDGYIHLDFMAEHPDGILYAWAIVGIIISFLSALSVKRREILPLLPLIMIMAAGCLVGFVPVEAGSVVTFAGLIFIISYIMQARCDSGNFAKRLVMQMGVLFICVLLALSSLILPDSWFEKSLAEKIAESGHEENYHLTEPTMPEGDVNNLGAWDKDASAALRISMEQPQKMYLKGMVGEVYSGTSWDSLEKSTLAEYEDMFYWLHKYGYYSQSSIANAQILTDEETETMRMQVATIGACKENIYVPYALSGNDVLDEALIGDSEVYASKETGIYSYEYTLGSVPQWYLAQNALAATQTEEKTVEYLRNEESYRDFVYKNYLQLTNASIGVLDRVLGTEKKQRTLAEIRKNIFDTLEKHLVYDESVVTKNSGNDFFQYFMEQTKAGYSVHYATAAVLMLRYYGVPARYVEGYFLSAAEAEDYESGETIILTESHAHAWAEYYLDGIGWIPFEVTPGYVDNEELQLSDNVVSNQQIYDQNELKYTPPIQKEERQPLSNWRNSFEIRKEHIIALLAIILLFFIVRAASKRRKLRAKLTEINAMENKHAITSSYGYAVMLLGNIRSEISVDDSEAVLINREAMFSNHTMTDEQRQIIEKYTQDIRELCRRSWKWWEKIKYKFIECIYL